MKDSNFHLINLYRYGAVILLCGSALCYDLLPDPKNWFFFGIVAILLPISFKFDLAGADVTSRSVRWDHFDRFLGDLSYPLYISHLLVVTVAYALCENLMRSLGRPIGQTVIVLTSLLLAAALLRFVQGPIDQYRWQFAQASTESRAERRRKTRKKSK